jgi:hypothetical protein
MMKQLFTIVILAGLMLSADLLQAQRLFEVPNTPSDPADLYAIIMGDTINGGRVDENTIYQLENGGVYIISNRIVNAGWPLQIHAKDLENTALKPYVTRVPTSAGAWRDVARLEGDLSFKNLWVVFGETGPGQNHDWGRLRTIADGIRLEFIDCVLEKDRGGIPQVRSNNNKLFYENCIIRSLGNRAVWQGNGRATDAREFQIDSLVVKNCVIHNLQDRVFRSLGASGKHNYIEYDHNTVFNQFGRHGMFSFGYGANTIKVTNNIFADPIMFGTTPFTADEQTQTDNTKHFVFTIDANKDTIKTNFTFDNNNMFWTPEVLAYYSSNDSVSRVDLYSEAILSKIGGQAVADTTYFTEVLEFNSVPTHALQYVKDAYADPASTEMWDYIVEPSNRAGVEGWPQENLFDFSTLDMGYDIESASYTAATDGGAIGARFGNFGLPPAPLTTKQALVETFLVYPNPTAEIATFRYHLTKNDNMAITITDIHGKEISVVDSGYRSAGSYEIKVEMGKYISDFGVYFVQFKSSDKSQVMRLVYLNR